MFLYSGDTILNSERYRWSSAKAHLINKDDALVKVSPLSELVNDWGKFLKMTEYKETTALFQKHERTGRPLGSAKFLEKLENLLGRILKPQKPGKKTKKKMN